jgi:hypothetical protein
MRTFLLVIFFWASLIAVHAQLSWLPCTMPTTTLTLLAMGPNGELVTLLPTNPAQPRVSTDQGQTWVDRAGTGGPNGNFLSDARLHLTITGTILVWGSVNGGSTYNVWRSADGGNSFTQLGAADGIPGSRFFTGLNSSPNGDVHLYGEGVLRSTDDGQNWTSVVPSTIFLETLASNTTNMFGLFQGNVYKGDLDGSGFAAINTGGSDVTNGRGLARGLDQRIIAVGGADRVITTTDNGNIWQTANTGLAPTPIEFQHVAASLMMERWVIGKQISVRYTADAGASWQTAEAGLELAQNEPIQAIFCDSSGTFYLYGYFHLYRSEISTGTTEMPGEGNALLHPNPTEGPVRLAQGLAGQMVWVFDMAGREVMRTTIDLNGAVDLHGLENGRYHLRSAAGEPFGAVQVFH